MVMTQEKFYGGGVGSAGSTNVLFDPRVTRLVYLYSGYTGSGAEWQDDVSGWPAGLEFYVVNAAGIGMGAGPTTGFPTYTIQDGYVGVFRYTGSGIIFREYQYNTAGRTHGESTRSGTIATILAANTRATIAEPDCPVWLLTNCLDSDEVIFSRQDWSAYEDLTVQLSIDPAWEWRQVTIAGAITKPIDARDLFSTITNSTTECPTFDIVMYNNTTSGNNNVRFARNSTGELNPYEVTADHNDFVGIYEETSREGDYLAGVATDGTAYAFALNVKTGAMIKVYENAQDANETFPVSGVTRHVRTNTKGELFVVTRDPTQTWVPLFLRKYSAAGALLWTYLVPASASTKSYTRAYLTRNIQGLIGLGADTGTGNRDWCLVNQSGWQINKWDAVYHANIALSVEGKSIYFVCYAAGSPTSSWPGGGGNTYNLVKYNAVTGNFVWGYHTNSSSGGANFALTSNKVYVGKRKADTHTGQTTPANVITLNLVTGALEDEWGTTHNTAYYIDVDTVTGDVIYSSGQSTDEFIYIDAGTGSEIWTANDGDWVFDDGFEMDISGSAHFAYFENSGR